MNQIGSHPLLDKDIIYVFIGDSICKTIRLFHGNWNYDVSLPYLSCEDLIVIANSFGLELDQNIKGQPYSRLTYMTEIVSHCLNNHEEGKLISKLFEFRSFKKILLYHFEGLSQEYESIYEDIKEIVIEYLNNLLMFEGAHITNLGDKYYINYDDVVRIDNPNAKAVTVDYIKDIGNRALTDIDEKHYDSAITKARTLIEETLIFMIESKGVSPNKSGNIGKLYKQVKDNYDMHINKDTDISLKKLLSGLETIVQAICELRNNEGDSHGLGSKRYLLDESQARLAVNSSMIISEFLISIVNNQVDEIC